MATLTRTCRYGHGPLDEIPGLFGLTGYAPMTNEEIARTPAALLYPGIKAKPTKSFYSLQLLRCSTCGYVELVDEE